uniref:LysM domain-containing protein n=1 Tax=Hanusia phi TaxID=3032 RepID=A0A7S0EQB9_9CRYP|mmetsp:Transcript_29582/g.66927  ORF Transcript_29582/g.66927 Transcript_29582/m.66927 type:complete len:381 (+) Transcript_29582:147-1289(+)
MRNIKNSSTNMKNRNDKIRAEEEEILENGWEEEDDKNEKLPIKGLPASFPALRPSFPFRLALLINGLAVGVLPTLLLAFVPVPQGWKEQGVFWKDGFFLIVVALLGLGISVILTLIRVPVKYQLTRTRLHIVSWARSKWWWSPCYHLCTPSYSIRISDIISADVRRADCLLPPLCLPPPRTNFRSKQFCCVLYRRSLFCRLLTWTRTLYLSPEDPSDLAKLITQVIQEHGKGTLLPRRLPPPASSSLFQPFSAHLARETVNLPPAGFSSSSFASDSQQATLSKSSSLFAGMDLSSIQRDVELMKYRLEGTETLEGLALKFGCKVEELRRLNGIPSLATGCPLAAYKNLWVPLRSPEVKVEAAKEEEEERGADEMELEITG